MVGPCSYKSGPLRSYLQLAAVSIPLLLVLLLLLLVLLLMMMLVLLLPGIIRQYHNKLSKEGEQGVPDQDNSVQLNCRHRFPAISYNGSPYVSKRLPR